MVHNQSVPLCPPVVLDQVDTLGKLDISVGSKDLGKEVVSQRSVCA